MNHISSLPLIEDIRLGVNPWQRVIFTSRQRPGSRPVPGATDCEGTAQTTESAGGQFPSHPGRLGPETSSEGTHLTPNPQDTGRFLPLPPPAAPQRALQTPLFPLFCCTVPPSLPHFSSSEAPKPRKFKASGRARANPRAPFPEPAQMKFYSLHEKITGGGRKKKQKTK